MRRRTRARIILSTTGYSSSKAVEKNTETITVQDSDRNTVLEITPYPSLGVAQVATMTFEQSQKIAEYLRRHSRVLKELERADLLVDITYVPSRSWNESTFKRIPAGSAVFPVLELATVPISHVEEHLS